MSRPDCDYQIRRLGFHYQPESTPLLKFSLYVLLSGAICGRIRQRLAGLGLNYDHNRLSIQHVIGERLFFLTFRVG